MPQAPPPGPLGPVPLDPSQPGRAAAWWVFGATGIGSIVLLLAVGGLGFIVAFPLCYLAAYATAVVRATRVRERLLAALQTPLAGQELVFRVTRLHPGVQPAWDRPSGILSFGQGRVRLWPDGLDLPADQIRVRAGSWWGKGGVFLDTPAGPGPRITFVTGFDPAIYWSNALINKPLSFRLEEMLADMAHRAVADLPSAGWYADPGGSGHARWWDGRGWTADLR
jgi:hypothetical protein